jgi:calcineurin-like phosphoesterase family protein
MIYFTSDLHFGHDKILEYCPRPYENTGEMNVGLIERINSVVSDCDTLYILGDIAIGNMSKMQAQELISQIHGKKILIRGNHEKSYDESLFEEVCDYKEITYKNILFVLFHYPIEEWKNRECGSIHLHGHIHSSIRYNEKQKKNNILRYDVGIDANNCYPVSIEDIIRYFDL